MSEDAAGATAKVLVYSDDRTVREAVKLALGRRVAADLPQIEVFEVATPAAAVATVDVLRYDLLVLDGEAVPLGGMGLARQLKDEVADCPPVLLLVARVQDAWLATWARVEAIAPFPIDPVRLPMQAAELLRTRRAQEAAR